MKFTRQTPLKTLLEVTGPGMSALATAPMIGAMTKGVEAYCAFLQGKGGQGASVRMPGKSRRRCTASFGSVPSSSMPGPPWVSGAGRSSTAARMPGWS
jgi:hypothetical protein